MSPPVQEREIELTQPQLITVGATAVTLTPTRLGRARRSFLSIVPVTVGVTVTLVFGDTTPALNTGLPIEAKQPFIQSLDVNKKGVYQGPIQAIATGPGQVALVEMFEGD